MLAMFGLGVSEIILILASLLVMVMVIGFVVALVVWLARRRNPPAATPPVQPNAPTRRFCHQCGTEMAADAPQGLCPSCLMKVALGSEGGNPAGAGQRQPAPPPADIARHFPQLEILELLGQGGMGMVYKARQRQLDRLVALKILPSDSGRDPAFAERFSREARALARLNHPNIVSVYDFGHTRGRRGNEADDPAGTGNPPPHVGSYAAGEDFYYFIMEFVDGVNLRQMEHTRRLAPNEALTIVPRICDALQYAHDEGVVHRDIKPENILIDKKGRVKIADFGLAKLLGQATHDFRLTDADRVMGTPHYMAPEQVEHPLDVDHRADIYSLGVVFYEMLTGELPLGKFASPSQKVQVDVRLDDVVLKALEKEPGRRYQQVSEVKTCVETIAGVQPLASTQQSPKPREDRFWKRFAVVIALGVAALILVPIAMIVLAMAIPAWNKARTRAAQHHAVAALNFGPTVERIIALGEVQPSGVAFVNLEKAEVMQPPFPLEMDASNPLPDFKHNGRIDEWIAASGVDLVLHLTERNWGVLPLGTRLIYREGEAGSATFLDETPIQEAQALLAGAKTPKGFTVSEGTSVSAYPITLNYLLKTRRGTRGLLQMTGFTNDAPGVKLRYKLVQTTSELATPVPQEIITDYSTTTIQLKLLTRREQELLADGMKKEHPWVKSERQKIDELSRHKADLETRYKLKPTGSTTKPVLASTESWSPLVAPGEKPDLQKILDEAKTLMTQGQYEESLQRHIWHFNHAAEFGDSYQSVVRLTSGLSEWEELGRRYPKARQALIEIRDSGTRKIAEGQGYVEMFKEVQAINHELQNDDATYALFKTFRETDPKLAGQCYFYLEELLVSKGEYQWCLSHMGDPQRRFDSIRQSYVMQLDNHKRMAEMHRRTTQQMAEMNQKRGWTNSVSLPDSSEMMKKSAEGSFVGQTSRLIEILVGAGRKTDAEKIREQAVAVLNDARLKSAISDAEIKAAANNSMAR